MQDSNRANYAFIHLLCKQRKSLYVVGDADQSIYGWRGAKYKYIQDFKKRYNAKLFSLEQNYRSGQEILDVAMSLIKPLKDREEKNLQAQRNEKSSVMLVTPEDEIEEADFIMLEIRELLRSANKPKSIAVMYRTNAQSRAIEDSLIIEKIPYRIFGGVRFYERKEVKDALAYLQVVNDPENNESMMRIINFPSRHIGLTTQEKILSLAAFKGMSVAQLLIQISYHKPGHRSVGLGLTQYQSACALGEKLSRWINLKSDFENLLNTIVEDVKFIEEIDDGSTKGDTQVENIQELIALTKLHSGKGLFGFLEHVKKMTATYDKANLEEMDDTIVTLTTLHAAKGLEFKVVFIAGVDEGHLPHHKSMQSQQSLDEERRLLYVGITRAEDKLYISSPQKRTDVDEKKSNNYGPSRFLDDIPSRLFDRIHQ
jgi:DNA helicase-2/ATP-dependent DNA helicase PcrA